MTHATVGTANGDAIAHGDEGARLACVGQMPNLSSDVLCLGAGQRGEQAEQGEKDAA